MTVADEPGAIGTSVPPPLMMLNALAFRPEGPDTVTLRLTAPRPVLKTVNELVSELLPLSGKLIGLNRNAAGRTVIRLKFGATFVLGATSCDRANLLKATVLNAVVVIRKITVDRIVPWADERIGQSPVTLVLLSPKG